MTSKNTYRPDTELKPEKLEKTSGGGIDFSEMTEALKKHFIKEDSFHKARRLMGSGLDLFSGRRGSSSHHDSFLYNFFNKKLGR